MHKIGNSYWEVTKFGNLAFKGVTIVTNIEIPTVPTFGINVFDGITTLKHTDLAENIIIPEGTFSGCSELNNVSRTQKVATVRKEAFKDCAKLENLNLYAPLTSLSDTLTTVKNLFFHGTAEPTTSPTETELNSNLNICVTENYTVLKFGKLTVLKSVCINFECVDVSLAVKPSGKMAVTPKCKNCENNFLSVDGANYYCEYDMAVCLAAHANCKVCAVDKCYQCKDDKYLKEDLFECFDTCDNWYFKDTTSDTIHKCGKCITDCKTCTDATKCTECTTDNLKPDNTCKAKIPEGYYAKDKVCTACVANCKTCTEETKCTACKDDALTVEDTKKCVKDKCPEMYYKSEADKMCKKCTDKCKVCSNANDCQECVSPNMLEEGIMKCVEKCEDGFYKANNTNRDMCMEKCIMCASKEKCDKCKENFFLSEDKCVDMCPEKYFEKEGKCEKCKDKYETPCKEGDKDTNFTNNVKFV
ncbi:hypothetical protein EIN_241600 [Entamoeba invadens IP1]|uniref:Uncharacterized protein n=1 Tax=Entamoeba invadens IP1 TaxID=370355 RepID=A0A0A1TUR8_ENTIV|nr:hypothetical protein EIN_241600 [Entamoeba invadens IP1]ELP83813.1 hypothetical protein EIN_241600 [Entamoeba invadens IP1]|eukprot:XP_004183159.1 hypothetical protein EIN_241600 [Entamoeba invadens IP1]